VPGVLAKLRAEATQTDLRPVDAEAFVLAGDNLVESTARAEVRTAIFGAVAGGAHLDAEHAQSAMGGVSDVVYQPRPDAARTYERLYAVYVRLHDAFGRPGGELPGVMKELFEIRAGSVA